MTRQHFGERTRRKQSNWQTHAGPDGDYGLGQHRQQEELQEIAKAILAAVTSTRLAYSFNPNAFAYSAFTGTERAHAIVVAAIARQEAELAAAAVATVESPASDCAEEQINLIDMLESGA